MTDLYSGSSDESGDMTQPSAKALEMRAYREQKAQERAEQKAANADIAMTAKVAKKKNQGKRSVIGVSEGLLKQVVARNRGDIHKQVVEYMKNTKMPAAIGRKREASDKSRADHGKNLMLAVELLREIGMPIKNLSELSAKHVIELVVYWKDKGHVAATIQTRVSAYRKFFAMVGKADALPRAREFYLMLARKGIDIGSMRRTLAVTEGKAWSIRGVDFAKVHADVRAEDEFVASQLRLELAFGLRLSEAVHARPNHNPSDDGLWVIDGAKGGLSRLVAMSTNAVLAAEQRAALEEAKILASMHPRGMLIRKGQTLRQAKDRFYTVMKKVGVTKKALGVTGHGLRHEYANNLFEEVSGMRPPVDGVHTAQEYEDNLDAVERAQKKVSIALGHARPSISGAYNGSRHQIEGSKMTRESRMLLNNVVGILEQAKVASVFREFGTDMAWLTGRVAVGGKLRSEDHLDITVRMKMGEDGHDGMVERYEALEQKLNTVVRRKVVLTSWMKKADPDPSVDGFIRVFGW